jgi:hypothetical protein
MSRECVAFENQRLETVRAIKKCIKNKEAFEFDNGYTVIIDKVEMIKIEKYQENDKK